MVDLMMWLVIAALLLAAAIQGIGFYQQAAYQYQMKEAAEAAAGRVVALSAEGGNIKAEDADKVVAEINAATPNDKITLSVGTVDMKASGSTSSNGMELASVATTVLKDGEGLYLRAAHDLVTNKDVLYYFTNTASMSAGIHVVAKGTDGIGSAIVTPPSGESTASPTATPTPTPTPTPTMETPPADSINTSTAPIAHSSFTALYANPTAQSTTSAKKQVVFTISGVVNTSDYEVVWTGSNLGTTNSKFTPTASSSKYWFIDITPTDARGFTTGESQYTATVKKIATGETSVKTWKLTITPAAITSHPSFTALYTDRSVLSTTSAKVQYVFRIPGATLTDYTVEWTGGAETNGKVAAMSGGDGSYWFGDVTPTDARGFVTGVSTITATVTHKGSGTVLTKSWKLTVTPAAITAHPSFNALYTDRTTTATTSTTVQYVFRIDRATLPEYNVEWSGGSEVNAKITPQVGGDGSYWFGDVTPADSRGFIAGTSTITAKVTHPGSGTVFTKSWKITVNAPSIVAHGSYASLFTDRSSKSMETDTTQFLFTVPNAKASDYTVTWEQTGDSLNASYVPKSNATEPYWFIDVVPGTGGLSVGTSTIKATVTHSGSGTVLTKSWTFTVTQGGITAHGTYASLFTDRSATKGTTGTTQFLYTLPGNHADYEVLWTESNLAALNATMTPQSNTTSPYWFINVVPQTGGYTSGVAQFTTTVKHIHTGDIYTKTFKLTIP